LNIFYLHTDPVKAARDMVDKHVVKMILESAQILSTAHRVIDGVQYEDRTASNRRVKRWRLSNNLLDCMLYKATHVNHPMSIWARTTRANYWWLVRHLDALLEEYTYRYNKVHKVERDNLAAVLHTFPSGIIDEQFSDPPSTMDEEFIISSDPVVNYRNYYSIGKKHIHAWTGRSTPSWLDADQ